MNRDGRDERRDPIFSSIFFRGQQTERQIDRQTQIQTERQITERQINRNREEKTIISFQFIIQHCSTCFEIDAFSTFAEHRNRNRNRNRTETETEITETETEITFFCTR